MEDAAAEDGGGTKETAAAERMAEATGTAANARETAEFEKNGEEIKRLGIVRFRDGNYSVSMSVSVARFLISYPNPRLHLQPSLHVKIILK